MNNDTDWKERYESCIENYHEQEMEKSRWLGALWNLLFPDERDTWDYPAQMYRLVFAQVAAMRNELEELSLSTQGAGRTLTFKAGQADYVDPKPYEWHAMGTDDDLEKLWRRNDEA